MTAAAKKLLVAVRPKDAPILVEVLGSEFDMVVCHTYEEAKQWLDERTGLIICGVHFAGDRMFDLLTSAKCDSHTGAVPFFVVLGRNIGYSEVIVEAIRSATRLMGADGFVELASLEKRIGRDQAHEQLRHGIRQILSSDASPAAD